MLIWRTSWRISTVTAGRPQRCFDFHRQYDLNPARCQRIAVSRRDNCKCAIHLGKHSADASQYQSVNRNKSNLLGLARRSTLICCLSTRISASSATCDRNRSLAIPKISRHKSSIGYQHRAILSQLPARSNLRQGQVAGEISAVAVRNGERSSFRNTLPSDVVSEPIQVETRYDDAAHAAIVAVERQSELEDVSAG